MNEDLERVAQALYEQLTQGDIYSARWKNLREKHKDAFRDSARAAIESIREPSKAMLDAAMSQPGEQGYDDIWRVMVDTILAAAPINPLDHEQTK